MSRVLRPQLPGVAFHITARTHGSQPWFDESIRTRIEQHIVEGVTSSDARLLAWAVMPNHFHIVLRQGMRPLGWIMQPVMRRIALTVQRRYQLQGHVFERRFRSHACRDADHLRRAIVYTHLNPLRAGLCAESYAWSSAVLYDLPDAGAVCDVAVVFALRLFAGVADCSELQLRACYTRYVTWRIAKDQADASNQLCAAAEPGCRAGDAHFMESFCALPSSIGRPEADLRDKANELLARISADHSVNDLRGPRVPRELKTMRRELIAALLELRYSGRKIANFLRVSDAAVSKVASAIRYAHADGGKLSNAVR